MFSILVHCSPAEEDALVAVLWEAGTEGISEEAGGFRAFFADSVKVEEIEALLPHPLAEVRQELPIDWEQVTRDSFEPIAVGHRFYIAPPWSDAPTPEGRLRLVINPGMACGTGYHPCTQLCLEALEHCVRAGDAVLDVGVGSGILSEAAKLLGAALVVGCDIDSDAVAVARERADGPVFVGSADAVASGRFDVVVANISATVAEEMAGEFRRVAKPGGKLILSGFPEMEGIEEGEVMRREGWMCVVAG